MRKKKLSFLYSGTEVITDELRIGVVDMHHSDSNVVIRYHSPPWPFPEWDRKKRSDLTPIEFEVEEAPF